MNRYHTILVLFFVICFSDSLSAQKPGYTDAVFNEWKEFFDQSYGADFELVNGIKYVYPFFNPSDHPFLGEDRFYTGYAVINGRQFPDYRNCLFWAPNIPVDAGDTVSLDFFSSDLQGDYMVIVRGITDDGQPMHGECSFTVK